MAGRPRLWDRLRSRFAGNQPVPVDAGEQPPTGSITTIVSAPPRRRARLRGTVASITLGPRHQARQLQVELRDGTGKIRLVWMGRRSVPGIEVGQTLEVEGMLTEVDGDLVMFNPDYQLIADHA